MIILRADVLGVKLVNSADDVLAAIRSRGGQRSGVIA